MGQPFVLADSPAKPRHMREKLQVMVSEKKEGAETYVVASALFHQSADDIWKVLTDYKEAPKIFANLAKSEVLESNDNVVKLHQIVKPGFFPFTFEYVVNMTESPQKSIEWRQISGSFAAYEGAWMLEQAPKDEAATRVTYKVYLDANKFIPQWLLRRSLKGYLPEVFESVSKELSRRESNRQKSEPNG